MRLSAATDAAVRFLLKPLSCHQRRRPIIAACQPVVYMTVGFHLKVRGPRRSAACMREPSICDDAILSRAEQPTPYERPDLSGGRNTPLLETCPTLSPDRTRPRHTYDPSHNSERVGTLCRNCVGSGRTHWSWGDQGNVRMPLVEPFRRPAPCVHIRAVRRAGTDRGPVSGNQHAQGPKRGKQVELQFLPSA
jgi:hypothetical protein